MAQPIKTHAITLRTMDYRDADRIVSLFTREHGRVDALLKGVRKKSSSTSAVSQTLALHDILYRPSRGTSGLVYVQQAKSIESFPRLRSELWLMSVALVAAEWVYLCAESTHEAPESTFDELLLALRAIEQSDGHAWPKALKPLLLLQRFLLNELGVWPELHSCIVTQQPLPTDRAAYRFVLPMGGLMHPGCQSEADQPGAVVNISGSTLLLLQHLEGGWQGEFAVANEKNACQKLLRFLMHYLSTRLEKPLKSEALVLQAWS